MSQLKNKVAVVTGASKGIGASIAEHLAAAGAAVVVNYSSSKEGADRVVEAIKKKGGKAIAVQANLSKPDEVQKLFAETKKHFDKVDILVNNAGIYAFAPIEEITPELFHKQFDLNVLGLLLATKEAVKLMGSAGGTDRQHQLGRRRCRASHGQRLQRDQSRRECDHALAGPGARPPQDSRQCGQPRHGRDRGLPRRGDLRERFPQGNREATPLGRIGQPQDIAPAVVFLASDDSAWTTGETLYISGGLR